MEGEIRYTTTYINVLNKLGCPSVPWVTGCGQSRPFTAYTAYTVCCIVYTLQFIHYTQLYTPIIWSRESAVNRSEWSDGDAGMVIGVGRNGPGRQEATESDRAGGYQTALLAK